MSREPYGKKNTPRRRSHPTGQTRPILPDAEFTLATTGERVRVLAVDSDERARVWVVLVEDPDRAVFVRREELEDQG